MILFPDNYEQPDGIPLNNINIKTLSSGSNYPDFNSFTASQWSAMESAGAIFFPAAGYRSGINSIGRHYGYSVRLVQNVQ